MIKSKKIKTRFAPSPTGFLHVGGLRTALYNFLFARQKGGSFILRIEDTDRVRIAEGAEENILETLKLFGLIFDEGPFKQSERLEKYRAYCDELLKKELAYKDADAVRFKMEKKGTTKFTDIIRGEIEIENKLQEDFIILKSDGFPTYNLAHLIDDHEMGITHVIRGEEFISSMPKYLALHSAFGWAPPEYAHLPLLLNKNRTKLSKREGDLAVLDYLNQGYLKEALLNFVALLGWHPSGSEKEIFSLEELISDFKLENVQKAGAIFDLEKLDWMNGEYIRTKPLDELVALSKPFMKDFLQFSIFNFQFPKILKLEQFRLKKLSDLPELTNYFFKEPEYDKELLRWKKMKDDEIVNSLGTAKFVLQSVSENDFTKENLEKLFLESAKNFADRGELLWPLRAALTGKKASPGPFEIMEILGKNNSISRLSTAISMLK
ncbi:glutamate--tRNA ligase [Candidatus Giovannonibacteria bacterium]|nr:glutamate--tRNA ligase [Candidatus Giovannonibacteria bacterium]